MEDSLAPKHSVNILLKLLENGTLKKFELRDIAPSTTLDKVLPALETDGYIDIKQDFTGHKVYFISLTEKGRAVGKHFKKAEQVALGEESVEISDQEAKDFAGEFRESIKGLSLLYHVNVFLDNITIGEEKNGRTKVVQVYVRLNGNSVMRLWCEDHESFQCIHTMYAWTLPEVQEMVQRQREKGEFKRVIFVVSSLLPKMSFP